MTIDFENRSRNGGQGGIRTHGTLSRTHAFQACALNHSATCPPGCSASLRPKNVGTARYIPMNFQGSTDIYRNNSDLCRFPKKYWEKVGRVSTSSRLGFGATRIDQVGLPPSPVYPLVQSAIESERIGITAFYHCGDIRAYFLSLAKCFRLAN